MVGIKADDKDALIVELQEELASVKSMAQKARAGSDTPQRLFCWMLKNNELVQ